MYAVIYYILYAVIGWDFVIAHNNNVNNVNNQSNQNNHNLTNYITILMTC